MPNISAMIGSGKYLREADVTPAVTVTIKRVAQENMARNDQPQELKWVCYFHEVDKGLALNATNTKRIAKALLAEDTDQWLGKKIALYFDPDIEFGGKITGGIRVKRAPVAANPADGLRNALNRPNQVPADDLDSDIP